MNNLTIWIFVALSPFATGIILFSPSRVSASNLESPQNKTPRAQSQNTSDEILRVLMPNGVWGDASQWGSTAELFTLGN